MAKKKKRNPEHDIKLEQITERNGREIAERC